MKLLVLTNPEHKDFVRETLFKNDVNAVGKPHLAFIHDREKFNFYSDIAGWYEVGISFMYQHKVPAKEVNSRPWFNFHPAPLPEYKGRNLCYHAIMNSEEEFGTTFHYMDENFDTGDIIDCFKFKILESDTAETLSKFAIEQCKSQFRVYLPDILAGRQFERIPNVGGQHYQKLPIDDVIHISQNSKRWIRAVYYPPHYPIIDIGGVKYKIVKDE